MKRHPLAVARRHVSSANNRTLKTLPQDMLFRLHDRVGEMLEQPQPIPTEADHFLCMLLDDEFHRSPNVERRLMQLAGSVTYRALYSDDQRIVKQLRERGLDPTVSRYLLHARLYFAGRLAGRAEARAEDALAAISKREGQSSTDAGALSSHRTVHSSPSEGDRG